MLSRHIAHTPEDAPRASWSEHPGHPETFGGLVHGYFSPTVGAGSAICEGLWINVKEMCSNESTDLTGECSGGGLWGQSYTSALWVCQRYVKLIYSSRILDAVFSI